MVEFRMGLWSAAVAFVLTGCIVSTAMADDFMKECKAGTPLPEADKICKCMSDKITGSDRANVVEAMIKSNAVMAKGSTADTSVMTPKVIKGVETAMTVQAQCM